MYNEPGPVTWKRRLNISLASPQSHLLIFKNLVRDAHCDHMNVVPTEARDVRSLGGGVTKDCEPPERGPGN